MATTCTRVPSQSQQGESAYLETSHLATLLKRWKSVVSMQRPSQVSIAARAGVQGRAGAMNATRVTCRVSVESSRCSLLFGVLQIGNTHHRVCCLRQVLPRSLVALHPTTKADITATAHTMEYSPVPRGGHAFCQYLE